MPDENNFLKSNFFISHILFIQIDKKSQFPFNLIYGQHFPSASQASPQEYLRSSGVDPSRHKQVLSKSVNLLFVHGEQYFLSASTELAKIVRNKAKMM